MQQLHSNWWCFFICVTFLLCSLIICDIFWVQLWQTLKMLRFYVTCLLEGNVCLLIAKTFLSRLFLHLNWKVGWTKWFCVFFFWCYFTVYLVVCIAVLLCNYIFLVLLHNLVLIVQIFQHLKNFWITFHWWFEWGV